SRLARGRALLAKRLARRGLTVPAAALAAVPPQQAASGAVPAALLSNTVKAALHAGAAGATSAQVAALTNGVLNTMALGKHKAAGVLLLTAVLVLCGGVAAYHVLAGQSN